jgi:hypothetical protein
LMEERIQGLRLLRAALAVLTAVPPWSDVCAFEGYEIRYSEIVVQLQDLENLVYRSLLDAGVDKSVF